MAECEPIKMAHKKLIEALLQISGEKELEAFAGLYVPPKEWPEWKRKVVRNLVDSIEEIEC